MKNVLQLIGSFNQGGSERQAVQLTRLLREDGRVNVAIAALTDEGVLRAEVERLGFTEFPEFRLTSFYDANFFKQLRRAARFLRENRIDVVHTHDFYTNVFGMFAARLARVPLAVASKRETGGMRTKLQKTVEKIAFRQSNAIVVNSAAVKDYLIAEGVTAAKIEVVYNGLDLERLRPPTTDRAAVCGELKLPAAAGLKFVTLVANLRHPVKNQPMFLRAARKVTEKFPRAHFVLAGEGALREDLERLAADLNIAGNVHFTGLCKRVPELLAVSFAGVLTSFNEGFSNSILEYMAAGLPVVATRVGGAAEAVVENETGFLVESDDADALAARLIELLEAEDKAARFGARGRRIAEEKFSLGAQLAKTLELYGV
ncbi:MAG: glycosyltransferase [Acidobacteria bacterium]|nr:glycosyltransferase [Acidobacteriota bacterium]